MPSLRLPIAVLAAVLGVGTAPILSGQDFSVLRERFALAEDRDAFVEMLESGSWESFYFRCLHLQNEGRHREVTRVLEEWVRREGVDDDTEHFAWRQLMLGAEDDLASACDELIRRLELGREHSRQALASPEALPSRLDASILRFEVLAARALADEEGDPLAAFTERGLRRLPWRELSDERLGELLDRLERPDFPELAEAVVRDWRRSRGGNFGSRRIHERLLLAQIEDCARLEPELLEDGLFVDCWLQRIRPPQELDPDRHPGLHRERLDRLLSVVRRLPESWNSLRAHVLHHRLADDLHRGVRDRELLREFLELPRHAEWAEASRDGRRPIRPGASFPTGLPPAQDEKELVRALLEEHFANGEDPEAFSRGLRPEWLARVHAESRLLAGADPERWSAALDPARVEAWRSEFELGFAPTQQRHFSVDETVWLELDVRNVGLLRVRSFEVDTEAWYLEHRQEVPARIELAGLLPEDERLLRFDEPPLLRHRVEIELPELDGPGVFAIEVLGPETVLQAVIHKGRLRLVSRSGIEGQELCVHDERGRRLLEASLWIDGVESAADDAGFIRLPFGEEESEQEVLVRTPERCELHRVRRLAAKFELRLGHRLAREEVLPGERATLHLRPSLLGNGHPLGLERLDEVMLTWTWSDRQGNQRRERHSIPRPADPRSWAREFIVPSELASLTIDLDASLSIGRDARRITLPTVSLHREFGRIALQDAVRAPLLVRGEQGWCLELRGRNGEPISAQGLRLDLRHREIPVPCLVALRTDERGRITLGRLDEIERLRVVDEDGEGEWFGLPPRREVELADVGGVVGEILTIPFPGRYEEFDRVAVSLLEQRDGVWTADRSERVSCSGDRLRIEGLGVGQYELRVRNPSGPDRDRSVAIHVLAGPRTEDGVLGEDRVVRAPRGEALAIESLADDGEFLECRLAGNDQDTLVHLCASRFLAARSAFDELRIGPEGTDGEPLAWPVEVQCFEQPESSWSAASLPGERRYVLARRDAGHRPGVLLERPSMLLHEWSPPHRVPVPPNFGGGGARAPGSSRGGAAGDDSESELAPPWRSTAASLPDLGFLPPGARWIGPLRPDADGTIRIARAELGDGNLVQVVAVRGARTASAFHMLGERAWSPRDRRLAEALDATRHPVEDRRVVALGSGETLRLGSPASARWRAIADRHDLFDLFVRLAPDAGLEAFRFLLDWESRERDRQEALASEFASHELHLFLWHHDRDFFDQILRPFLSQKLQPTFLDDWLLERPLERYTTLHEYAELNRFERLLLAERLPDRAPALRRQLEEEGSRRFEDPELRRRSFEAALGRGLSDEPTELPADPVDFVDHVGPRDSRTRLLAERGYWKRSSPPPIDANDFWRDLAGRSADEPFLSPHLMQATASLSEMLLALALLDLPARSDGPPLIVDRAQGTLEARTALLLFLRDLREVEGSEPDAQLPIGRRYFRLDASTASDRAAAEAAEPEFLIGVPYSCQVIVGNPRPERTELDVLVQIPEGSIPVGGSSATEARTRTAEPWSTLVLEQHFTFPEPGTFAHFPPHVRDRAGRTAWTEPRRLVVVDRPSSLEEASWIEIARSGSRDQILSALDQRHPETIDLSRIAGRMGDAATFLAVTDALRRRGDFDPELWSYSLMHRDPRTAREYLRSVPEVVERCGPVLDSPLLRLGLGREGEPEHLEFRPVIPRRAHSMAHPSPVRHEGVHAISGRWFDRFAHQRSLEHRDLLLATHCLVHQERPEEARAAFARIRPEELDSRIQYDLLHAFLLFASDDPGGARLIAERYEEHPVTAWRQRFQAVRVHLDEAEGRSAPWADLPGSQRVLEPRRELELELDGARLIVHHRGLDRCELRSRRLDAELAFSRAPFEPRDQASSVPIRPRAVETFALDPEAASTAFPIPDSLLSGTRVLEVRAGDHRSRVVRRAAPFAVELREDAGQLRVAGVDGRPAVAHYVKVYARIARRSGVEPDVRFHKDGYTDHRGRFDYHRCTEGHGSGRVERYALLVIDEDGGSAIREVGPPVADE